MWTVKLKGVPRAVNRHAVSVNGKIYSFAFRYVERDSIDVYIFYPASYRWAFVKTQPLPGGRPRLFLDSAVVAHGDCAYVYGGWVPQESDAGDNLYCFDTSTMTWSRPKVCGDKPRYVCHAACVVGDRMYILGGQPLAPSQHVHFLDLDTYRWHRVHTSGDAPMCPPFNSACSIGSRIYVWGGTAYDNSVFYLDTATSTWVRPNVEGVAQECRFSHNVFEYKGEMYIFGGYSRKLRTLFADVHKYDPVKSCWTQVSPKGSGPCARVFHACCLIGDKAFVFRGRHPKPTRGGQSTRADRELVPLYSVPDNELTDLHVLDFAPTLQTLCGLAVIDARVEIGDLPETIKNEISVMTDDDSTRHPS